MKDLIPELIQQGYISTPAIIEAFYKIERRDFLPAEIKEEAGLNAPLPIGEGQTISQPLTVAFMLELLEPKKGKIILDVGSGSGWQTALLAELVGENGKVYAIERIPSLKKFGEENIKKYNFNNTRFFLGDGSKGLPEFAPFDRIVVAAACENIPEALINQLAVGGRLVIPVGKTMQDIVLIKKINDKEVEETRYPGFQFVPLISDNNLNKGY